MITAIVGLTLALIAGYGRWRHRLEHVAPHLRKASGGILINMGVDKYGGRVHCGVDLVGATNPFLAADDNPEARRNWFPECTKSDGRFSSFRVGVFGHVRGWISQVPIGSCLLFGQSPRLRFPEVGALYSATFNVSWQESSGQSRDRPRNGSRASHPSSPLRPRSGPPALPLCRFSGSGFWRRAAQERRGHRRS